MTLPLWHPTATRQIYKARGKAWSGGAGNPKFGFHMTETRGYPNYSAPPHMTLHPSVGLRQHIPFDKAAYSVRSGKVDTMRFFYQIDEVIGRAAASGIITSGEVAYWKDKLATPNHPEWEGYRRAVEVRRV